MKVGAFSVNEDTAANHFTGTPTHEIIPSLPPYHFGCRTRIVPYTHGDAYDAFDTMKPTDKLYPTILKDKLANYSITPQNLDTVRTYAHQCQWKKDSLEEHYKKHNPNFHNAYKSKEAYSKDAFDLLDNKDATLMIYNEAHGSHTQIYAMIRDPKSRSGSWKIVVFDLDLMRIQSYYKKSESDIRKFIKRDDYRKQTFGSILKSKGEITMFADDYTLEQALLEFDELLPVRAYEYAYEAVEKREIYDACLYQDDVVFYRANSLRLLINAKKLSEDDLARIKKVDEFILSAKWLPNRLIPLKDWLKTNHL